VTIASRRCGAPGAISAVRRDRLIGLAALGPLGVLGRRHVAVGEAVFVAVAGDVHEALLGQLEALRLALARLDQRLPGGIVALDRRLTADVPGFLGRGLRLFLDPPALGEELVVPVLVRCVHGACLPLA